MDWELAIKLNRDALLRIVGMLCAAAGIVLGGEVPTLKRHVRNHVMRFLRSAESATRRVIYIRALEIEVPEPAPRSGTPSSLSRTRRSAKRCSAETGPPRAQRGLGSGAGQSGTNPPTSREQRPTRGREEADRCAGRARIRQAQRRRPGRGGRVSPRCGSEKKERKLAFPLIDPRKRFFDRKPKRIKGPGPRVRSLFDDDWAPSPPPPPEPPEPHPDDPVSGKRLCQRLLALHAALEDIPGQARRMARIMARRAKAPPGPGCVPPLRPGYPPGHRNRHIHPVDAVLKECQSLAHMRMRDVYAAAQHVPVPP